MKAILEIELNADRVSGNAEARRLIHVAIDKVNKKFREELGAEYIIFDKMKFVEFPLDKTGVINRGVERWHMTSEK